MRQTEDVVVCRHRLPVWWAFGAGVGCGVRVNFSAGYKKCCTHRPSEYALIVSCAMYTVLTVHLVDDVFLDERHVSSVAAEAEHSSS